MIFVKFVRTRLKGLKDVQDGKISLVVKYYVVEYKKFV